VALGLLAELERAGESAVLFDGIHRDGELFILEAADERVGDLIEEVFGGGVTAKASAAARAARVAAGDRAMVGAPPGTGTGGGAASGGASAGRTLHPLSSDPPHA
jgi:hypothetical protein